MARPTALLLLLLLPMVFGLLPGAAPASAQTVAAGQGACRGYVPGAGVIIAIECPEAKPVAAPVKMCRRYVHAAQMLIEEPCTAPAPAPSANPPAATTLPPPAVTAPAQPASPSTPVRIKPVAKPVETASVASR